jgi:hypothetical protein
MIMVVKCLNDWHNSAPGRAQGKQNCPECPERPRACRYCDEQASFLITDRPDYEVGSCQLHLRRVIEAFLFALGSLHVTVNKIKTEE